MPIITTRTVHISTQESIKCLQCDKCAREFYDVGFADANIIKLSGGYGNSFPSDMQNIEIVVCGPCTKEWVDSFKLPLTSSNVQADTCFDLDGTPYWYYGGNNYYVAYREKLSEAEWRLLWSYVLADELSLDFEERFLPGATVAHEGKYYELIGTLVRIDNIEAKTFEVFFLAYLCDGKSVHPLLIPSTVGNNDYPSG